MKLKVFIFKARDLAPKDKNGFSDPFVVVKYGKSFKTKIIKKCLNPEWNESFEFDVSYLTISFNVWDHDHLRNDFMGTCSVDLQSCFNFTPTWLKLHPKQNEEVSGEIYIDLKLEGEEQELIELEKSLSLFSLDKTQSPSIDFKNSGVEGFVFLKIISATSLPKFKNATKTGFDMDPFVVISYGKKVAKTKRIKHTINPTWNESVCFQVNQAKTFNFSIYDHDKFSSNDFVGDVDLPLELIKQSVPDVVFVLRIKIANEEFKDCVSALLIDATFLSLESLRRNLWRTLIQTFDQDTLTNFELMEIYDVLGIQDTTDVECSSEEAVELLESKFLENNYKIESCPFCKNKENSMVHVSICAYKNPHSDSWLTTSFGTEAQITRKLITRTLRKITFGEYSKDASILVAVRETGLIFEEKMPIYIRLGMRLLHTEMTKKAQQILKNLTFKYGKRFDSFKSRLQIPHFIEYHDVNTDEILRKEFNSFNEFFYRELKPNSRPFVKNPNVAVSPADCRCLAFKEFQDSNIWIKGKNFTLEKLTLSTDSYASMFIFRLAPQDYHRFHSPVDGKIVSIREIEGTYYTVNPMGIHSTIDVFTENKRTITLIQCNFGMVCFVAIGAMMVGSIRHTKAVGSLVSKMDEIGYFAYGGSTIILLFQNIEIDSDLLERTKTNTETLIRAGMSIGRI